MADAVLDRNNNTMGLSNPYLQQGANETVDNLRSRYAGLITQGNFNQGDASGPLSDRLSALNTERMGDMRGTLDRNMNSIYADRMNGFKGVSDQNMEIIKQREMLEKQKEMAKKAKRKAFTSAALGLAGAVAGNAIMPGVGGAMIGGGVGTTAGSML